MRTSAPFKFSLVGWPPELLGKGENLKETAIRALQHTSIEYNWPNLPSACGTVDFAPLSSTNKGLLKVNEG